MDEVSETVQQIGEQIESGLHEVGRRVRSGIRRAPISEATIPDAFRAAPKIISPRIHAWLDVMVAGYYLTLGTVFAFQKKKGAATAAFVNGGIVAGISMLTDYDGTGEKPISFKMHGTLDAVQATTAALAPALHGFGGKSRAAFFYGQATNELAVIALTDWDAGMPARSRRKAA
jgi:hypothetical protein